MNSESHVTAERLTDYFAAELGPEEQARVEDHVFECARCSSQFELAGELAAALRSLIPPVITHQKLDRFGDQGLSLKRVAVDPGARIDVVFDRALALIVFALRGQIAADERVDLEICAFEGQSLVEVAGVPVDRESGEVLIACQRHYMDAFPPLIRFRTWAVRGDERRPIGDYVVNHIIE